jgi:hypothetical protein
MNKLGASRSLGTKSSLTFFKRLIAGSGIQVRILSSAGKARAAQNPYLFRTTKARKSKGSF